MSPFDSLRSRMSSPDVVLAIRQGMIGEGSANWIIDTITEFACDLVGTAGRNRVRIGGLAQPVSVEPHRAGPQRA